MRQFTPNISSKAMMNRESFKLVLMFLMVLDHISYFISPYLADFFHIITRVVAVGFAYLVVEGMYYTHSRKDYLLRLFGWSLFMAIGNWLMNLFVLRKQYSMSIIGDNIFLTLTIGALIIALWDNHAQTKQKQRGLKIAAVIILLLGSLPIIEGSMVILPFMFLTQLTHSNVKLRNWSYLGLAAVLGLIELPMALTIPNPTSLMIYDSIAMNASDIFFVMIIPMLHFYNGKIGQHSRQMKYLFYIFYPAHLWIIHLLANMM